MFGFATPELIILAVLFIASWWAIYPTRDAEAKWALFVGTIIVFGVAFSVGWFPNIFKIITLDGVIWYAILGLAWMTFQFFYETLSYASRLKSALDEFWKESVRKGYFNKATELEEKCKGWTNKEFHSYIREQFPNSHLVQFDNFFTELCRILENVESERADFISVRYTTPANRVEPFLHKGLLIDSLSGWAVFWPVSILDTFFTDILVKFFRRLADFFNFLFKKLIAELYIKLLN